MMRTLGSSLLPVMGGASWALSPLKPAPKPVVPPKKVAVPPDTPKAELEAVLAKLDAHKAEWAAMPLPKKAAMFRACMQTTIEVSKEAAQVETDAKGSWHNGIAEAWSGWSPIVTGLKEYAEAMEAGGHPKPCGVMTRPDGQIVVDVGPAGLESLLLGGWKAEVWLEPGQQATQGSSLLAKQGQGGEVALVLGAGNQVSVATLDILHKLVFDCAVVVCKMNPVNAWIGPYIRRAFQPLVDAGFVEIVYGAGDVGKFLCQHPTVASVHLTGSSSTFDAIVWGENKAKKGKPALSKPVTGELGCTTPYIIVPGNWSRGDLEYHARGIATGKTHNAGHNCLAAELIITAADWPQREEFLDIFRKTLDSLPARAPNYPGSEPRLDDFCKRFPDAEEHGWVAPGVTGAQPVRLRTGLTPETAELDKEHWCSALQEVALPGTGADPAAFLTQAVDFANERCEGTLSCSVFIPPQVRSEAPAAVDAAMAGLRYGCIAVNTPGVLPFGLTRATWGGYPGTTLEDIGSGNCAVHNTLLLDHPQKSVVWAPWRYRPPPFWEPFNRNAEAIIPLAIRWLAAPSILGINAVALAALRG